MRTKMVRMSSWDEADVNLYRAEYRCPMGRCGYRALVPRWQLDDVIRTHEDGHSEDVEQACTCLHYFLEHQGPSYVYDPFCPVHVAEAIR